MNHERLYYADSYLRYFTAHVIARAEWNGQPVVALNHSAFYPEGGGQPADQGTLNEAAVLDVQLRDGLVWHLLDRPLPTDEVHGAINWQRRFDHMQQHHGQHLLSAAFVEAVNLATTSFHLGAQLATLDLDTPTLTPEQAQAAETLANQVVWEDRPVLARFVSRDELDSLPLRKVPSVAGPVRVVSVAGFDHSPCGGTHPRSTGSVGLIALQGWYRQKAGVRVEFVCGGRALAAYRRLNGLTGHLAAEFSVGQDQLVEAVERLRNAEVAARRALSEARAAVLAHTAQALLANAQPQGPARIVRALLENYSAEEVRSLALQIRAQPGGVALLGLGGERAQLVFACAHGLPLDAAAMLRIALPYVQGRGGGQAALAQGGGPQVAGLEEALVAALEAATATLNAQDETQPGNHPA